MEGQEATLYKCTGCEVLFHSMQDVEKHICNPDQYMATQAPQMNIYKCSGCGGLYNDINLFNSHICNPSTTHNQHNETISENVFSIPEAYEASTGDQVMFDETLQGQIIKDEPANTMDDENHQEAQQQQILEMAETFTDTHNQVERTEVPYVNEKTPEEDNNIEQRCPACSKVFCNLNALRLHKKNHHRMKNLVSCHPCGRYFSKQRTVAFHQRMYHRKRWPKSGSPANNTVEQRDEAMIDACTQHFHVKDSRNSDYYYCSECVARFSNRNQLREHEECLHGIQSVRKFECVLCDTSYSTRRDLVSHKHSKHQKEGFLCDEAGCTKSFKTKLALEFHIRAHLGLNLNSMTQNYSCSKCPRKFVQRRAYRRHLSLHGQKPQVCPWCNCVFLHRDSFRKHCRNEHSSRLRCGRCPNRFLSMGQLVKHSRKHHSGLDEEVESDPAGIYSRIDYVRADTAFFYCLKCIEIFTSHRALLQHYSLSRAKHSRTCTLCGGITFSTQHQYEQHQKIKHGPLAKHTESRPPRRLPVEAGKPSFLCSECGFNFRNKKGLGIHMGRAHPEFKTVPESKNKPQKKAATQQNTAPTIQESLAALEPEPVGCMISVSQEGTPIPISTCNKEPYTRILKVQEIDADRVDDTMRSARKKQLHYYIYQLRNHIQDGLSIVLPSQVVPDKDRSYASYFEDILNLPPIQACLSEMESVATGCRVTFSLPFPHNLVAMVWVTFAMSFERPLVWKSGET